MEVYALYPVRALREPPLQGANFASSINQPARHLMVQVKVRHESEAVWIIHRSKIKATALYRHCMSCKDKHSLVCLLLHGL